jgi:hypothetical protein
MRITKIFYLVLVMIYFLSCRLIAQDINIHTMVGKKLTEVIKKFGNPVHQDKSNPEMVCSFYKGDAGSMTFVSDNNGVYQAEAYKSYKTQGEARNEIDDCISKSISNGFSCDTVSIDDFQLIKPGVKGTLQINKNKITNKVDLHAKAVRTEG